MILLDNSLFSFGTFDYRDAEGDFGSGILVMKMIITVVWGLACSYYLMMFSEMKKKGGIEVHPFFNFALLYSITVTLLVWMLPVSSVIKLWFGIAFLFLLVSGVALMKYQLKTLNDFPFRYPHVFEMMILLACDLLLWFSGILLTGNWWLLLVLPLVIFLWWRQIRSDIAYESGG